VIGLSHSSRARFKSDELYRLVYQRDYDNEPDWDMLDTRYSGRIGYMLMLLYAVPVHPYSAGKYYVERRIDKMFVCNADEVRLPDGSDPSLVCYGDDVLSCD
jgi:hypothetical protein